MGFGIFVGGIILITAWHTSPWIPLTAVGLFAAYLAVMLLGAVGISRRGKHTAYIDSISPAANDLLRNNLQFYSAPVAAKVNSSLSSFLYMLLAGLAVIYIVKGNWVLFGACLIPGLAFAQIARFFAPPNFFTSQDEQVAHDELVKHLVARNMSDPARVQQTTGLSAEQAVAVAEHIRKEGVPGRGVPPYDGE